VLCCCWCWCSCTEFSQATANCCDLLEVAAARARVRASFEPAAAAWGEQASLISSHQQQQQQAVQLCPATLQGLKHWRQVQGAASQELWGDLWSSNAAKLEGLVSKAFAAGFGAHLEQSTLQHYVSGGHRLRVAAAAFTGSPAGSLYAARRSGRVCQEPSPGGRLPAL